jgi:hypothetical protein
VLAPESNSVSVIVRHMAGNMHSRWTDFLTSDGEKPTRHRDNEFADAAITRAEVMQTWEDGWRVCLDAITSLQPADLSRTITIRGEPHSVVEAINRQLTHYSYHVGQIVFIAKALRGDAWRTLSIAKNKSVAYDPALDATRNKGGLL